jgi:hypothetical protein
MEKKKVMICCEADGEMPRQLTAEELHEGEERLMHDFTRLLELLPSDNVRWTGSQTDLMELVYTAYLRGVVCDAEGYPASLKTLTCEICRCLHVAVPYNPSSMGRYAVSRKGIRRNTLLQRYTWNYKRKRVSCPLYKVVSGMTNRNAD